MAAIETLDIWVLRRHFFLKLPWEHLISSPRALWARFLSLFFSGVTFWSSLCSSGVHPSNDKTVSSMIREKRSKKLRKVPNVLKHWTWQGRVFTSQQSIQSSWALLLTSSARTQSITLIAVHAEMSGTHLGTFPVPVARCTYAVPPSSFKMPLLIQCSSLHTELLSS